MSLREYISRLKQYWLVFVLIVVGAVAAAWVYSAAQVSEYSARSTVLVSAQAGTTVQELQQGNNFMQGRVTTYTTLVTTPLILERVITDLGLDTTPGELATHIEALSPELTSLIEIAVTYPDAALAADIANSTAASLIVAVGEIEAPIVVTETPDAGTAPAVEIPEGTSPVRVEVVEPAAVPASASSPSWTINTVLGLAVGLIVAITVIALISTLGTRIRGVRDLRRVTNAPILGRIVHGSRSKPLTVVDSPLSARAESFRSLRTNVQTLADSAPLSIAVTCAGRKSDAGTSTILNLAIALTEAREKVVVVDANLRDPMVAALLDLPASIGLAEVLVDDRPLAEAVHRWNETDLYVVPAGRKVAKPSEVLSSPRMAELITELEREFDFVLVDTPAVLPVTDAAVVAKGVECTIIVCSAGRTKRGELAEALESLERANARVAGVALVLPRRPSAVDNDATRFEFIPGDDDGTPSPVDVRASTQPG